MTIEDAAELQLQQEHVARLETRPPNVEGKGAVRQRQLVDQRPAHAPRPHRRRRGPRRRSARHAAGDEHRPRRLADHRPRQHAARRADPYRDHDRDGLDQPAGAGDAPADRRRPSSWSCSRRASATARARSRASPRSPAWKATSSPCRRSSCSRSSASTRTARCSGASAPPACGRSGRAPARRRHPAAHRDVRGRDGGEVMLLAIAVFVVVTGFIVGGYVVFTKMPGWLAADRLDRRLRELSAPAEKAQSILVKEKSSGGVRPPGPRHRRGILARQPDRAVGRADHPRLDRDHLGRPVGRVRPDGDSSASAAGKRRWPPPWSGWWCRSGSCGSSARSG